MKTHFPFEKSIISKNFDTNMIQRQYRLDITSRLEKN